ncbi:MULTISPECIES: ribonucleoside-diphosphate reductase subunit alpha [unclassified Thioalkalivibrio]|uniref:ribonucleoside-diphosphate reductase subunit alpha n=1 Tax=unclassified Thioalkalivibrio TaxID=2621013 RepID=UPI00036C13C0|nr:MULTISPECIES: ribonucleoside-diphosphate reductase subunit alpha [unclassified Thioalkalivibrio]
MSESYHGIRLYPENDARLSDLAVDLLRGFYLQDGESIQEAFARPALAFCGGDLELAQAIYSDVSMGWAMYSSPILSNAPAPGKTSKAMPISCFLSYVADTREGLVEHQQELAWLSMLGGGVGGHWSDVRAVSSKSVGPMPHLKVADSAVEAFRQGMTRKGSYAAYLDISRPEIAEFLHMRMPTGGDVNRKCFNIHHAINITDDFMEALYADADWDLKCPHSGRVTDTFKARELWQNILETRHRTGEPYLNFIDTANRALPEAQKALGLKIHGSNLCNEIHLATDEDRTAVCCLSSVNLEKFDEWQNDAGFIARWVRFLDNVLQYFINTSPEEMTKARFSAYRERSIGLGQMGFHSLLQKYGFPWESALAKSLNLKISRHIYERAVEATHELAGERGEAPDMRGTGRRNAHLLAIAPNANSGLICGASPSIEPLRSNAYVHRTRAGSHLVQNEQLRVLLKERAVGQTEDEKAAWLEEVWQSILLNNGSVQHLECLTDDEKDVYKTAFEIDQHWVVEHAADRQQFVCQGQSVNLYFPHGVDKSYLNGVHLRAWKQGLKGLYYLRTTSGFTADKVSQRVERVALKDAEEECLACQG